MIRGLIDHHLLEQEQQSPALCSCCYYVANKVVYVCVCVAQQQQSIRLSELHRKAQLWRGIVSIALIEGRNLMPMDPNGLSDPYVKFRLGPQKYKSKVQHVQLRSYFQV